MTDGLIPEVLDAGEQVLDKIESGYVQPVADLLEGDWEYVSGGEKPDMAQQFHAKYGEPEPSAGADTPQASADEPKLAQNTNDLSSGPGREPGADNNGAPDIG